MYVTTVYGQPWQGGILFSDCCDSDIFISSANCARTSQRWPTLSPFTLLRYRGLCKAASKTIYFWLTLSLSLATPQAHPAERGHFRVGGDDGNYDIDTHINIADRSNLDNRSLRSSLWNHVCWLLLNTNDRMMVIFPQNYFTLIIQRLNAAETLQREAGEALKGCKILVSQWCRRWLVTTSTIHCLVQYWLSTI